MLSWNAEKYMKYAYTKTAIQINTNKYRTKKLKLS